MKKLLVFLCFLVGAVKGDEKKNMIVDFFDLPANIEFRDLSGDQLFNYFYPKGISINDIYQDLLNKSRIKDYLLVTEYYDSEMIIRFLEPIDNTIYTHSITFVFIESRLCEIRYFQSFTVYDTKVDISEFSGFTRKYKKISELPGSTN